MSQDSAGSRDPLIPELGAPRVLVVEDDYLLGRLIKESVEVEGYVALGPASHLEQALELAQKERVDLALLDISVGGKMVFPVAEILQQRNTPFVFLSGHRSDILPKEFEGRAMLRKPFSVESLFRAMHEAIAPKR